MKFDQFILLTDHEKREILMHRGVLIGKRTEDPATVFLFQMHLYYVEMYCDLSKRVVKEYRVFEGTGPLSPYLQDVSIDALLNNDTGTI
jgi:hypothetical protein